MNDNELLILAAKAAGYVLTASDEDPTYSVSGHLLVSVSGACGEWFWWNPRTDDGDALRLAVKLRLDFDAYRSTIWVSASLTHPNCEPAKEELGDDPYAAARRAIVRAAAEIGKAMP